MMNLLKGFWCYFMHQKKGHAIVFNVREWTWRCTTCGHVIESKQEKANEP
jgi:rRNA maturation endonuclease Nob1